MKPSAKVLDDIARHKDVFLALLRRAMPQVTVTTENPPLNCLKCSSFCCKLAGYVEVSRSDIRRLAKHLDLTVPEFEEKHIVKSIIPSLHKFFEIFIQERFITSVQFAVRPLRENLLRVLIKFDRLARDLFSLEMLKNTLSSPRGDVLSLAGCVE